jgi:ketosteroid isomerase-like protein
MSNVDLVNAFLTAIHFDRFAEIEARHLPDATFYSFRGPILRDSLAIADWHREFLKDYADCNYTDIEYVDAGDTVCVRATIQAKGYDWRSFEQRVLEVFEFEAGSIAERRQFAMFPDLALDKPAAASMTAAKGFRGGDVSTTAAAIEGFYAALLGGDLDSAAQYLDPKASLIDSVYGVATGPEQMLGLLQALPRPMFGSWRASHSYAGPKDGVVELRIDPGRPRLAQWVRMVEGKIMVIENYWMLREIGIEPRFHRERHMRQVILPT